jgi:hypothetical protein
MANAEMTRSFFPKGKIGSVDSENLWIAGGSCGRGSHTRTRNEAQFHQSRGDIGRKIDVIEYCVLSKRKLGKRLPFLETRLHL